MKEFFGNIGSWFVTNKNELIRDGLIVAGAIGAIVACNVLSKDVELDESDDKDLIETTTSDDTDE